MKSCNLTCNPRDSRCRYWAKVIRADDALPMPAAVDGANDIPGQYLRKGDDVELFDGDFLLEGEANHHVKQRGWTYDMRIVSDTPSERFPGQNKYTAIDYKAAKDAARAAGRKDLLLGSGDCAAMIRAIHVARMATVKA